MSEKKFLIWIDILGFEELAEEIAKKKGIESRKIKKGLCCFNIMKR